MLLSNLCNFASTDISADGPTANLAGDLKILANSPNGLATELINHAVSLSGSNLELGFNVKTFTLHTGLYFPTVDLPHDAQIKNGRLEFIAANTAP